MTVSYGKGAMGKATRLHSLIVRSKGFCESCGDRDYSKLQCAHIIPRRYSATRTDEANGFALCWSCHRRFTDWPLEWTAFVIDRIGAERYEALRLKAMSGIKVDWASEAARLQERLREAA